MNLKQTLGALIVSLCVGGAFSQTTQGEYAPYTNQCFAEDDVVACLRIQEQAYIKSSSGIAKRNGDEICLKTPGEEKVCFKDNTEENINRVIYFYAGQLPNKPSVAVLYSLNFEWGAYTFVSTTNGQELLVMGDYMIMSLSPNAKYIAFALADAHYNGMSEDQGVLIFEVKDQGEWQEVWANESMGEALINPQWVSDDELRLDLISFDNDMNPHMVGTFVIKQGADGWKTSVEREKTNAE